MSVEQFPAKIGGGGKGAGQQAFVRLTPLDPSGGLSVIDLPPDADAILIGRDADWSRASGDPRRQQRVVYPADVDVVGRRHLLLKREEGGGWGVYPQKSPDGKRYVTVLETQGRLHRTGFADIDSGDTLLSGSVLRLGDRTGPRLRFEIVGAESSVEGPKTRHLWRRSTERERLRRLTTAVAGLALATAIGGTGLYWYLQRVEGRVLDLGDHVAGLVEQVRAEIDARVAAATAPTPRFPEDVLARLRQAAHIIKLKRGDAYTALATAWPISETAMVTNAHVGAQIAADWRDGDEILVCAPVEPALCHRAAGLPVPHQAYRAFREFLSAGRFGVKTTGEAFRDQSFPGAYDVAVLTLAPGTLAGPVLPLAPDSSLKPGDEVAFAGYLLREVDDAQDAAGAIPTPHLHFGTVSAVTNFFMFATDPASANAQLVHTTIPVTGGASGGPIVNAKGEVVAILSSGTVNPIRSPGDMAGEGPSPSAVMVNYAQRVDVLQQMMRDEDATTLSAERAYWDEQAKAFVSYHQYLMSQMAVPDAYDPRPLAAWDELRQAVAPQYDVKKIEYQLEKGRRYRFLAYAETDDSLELKVQLGDQAPRTSGMQRAVTTDFVPKEDGKAVVTIVTSSRQDSRFELVVYRSED